MDLNHLEIFLAVAETSGISAAAKKLGIPKSSVSRALASLEDDLGVELVHRTTRHVALSAEGAALQARVGPQLAALQSSIEASVEGISSRASEPSGVLRVTAPIDFGTRVLADVVARFSARYPAVDVQVFLSNAFVDLAEARIDVAVRLSGKRLKDSSMRVQRVGFSRMQLFASPQYLARRGPPRTPRDLEEHAWVVYRGLEALHLEGPSPVRLAPKARIQADDMTFLVALVRAGAGIALLPSFLVEPEVLSGALVRVLPKWSVPSSAVYVLSPSTKNVPPKVTAFRELLLESLRAGAITEPR